MDSVPSTLLIIVFTNNSAHFLLPVITISDSGPGLQYSIHRYLFGPEYLPSTRTHPNASLAFDIGKNGSFKENTVSF